MARKPTGWRTVDDQAKARSGCTAAQIAKPAARSFQSGDAAAWKAPFAPSRTSPMPATSVARRRKATTTRRCLDICTSNRRSRRTAAPLRQGSSRNIFDGVSEIGRSGVEGIGISRLEDYFDVWTPGAEAGVGAYLYPGMVARGPREQDGDPALGRPVRPPPGADRRTGAQLVLDRLVHCFHLCGQARQHVDVLEHEPRRAAERVGERSAPFGKKRPARGVLRIAFEAGAQLGGDFRVLDLLDGERRGDGLARQVVRSTAETARDEDEIGAFRLFSERRRDLRELVRQHGDQADLGSCRL